MTQSRPAATAATWIPSTKAVRAATLAGAVTGPAFGTSSAWLGPPQQSRYELRFAEVVTALGAHSYSEAQQRGAAMTYDEIVAYTPNQLDRLTAPGSQHER